MTPAYALRKNVHHAFISLSKGARDCVVAEKNGYTLCTSSIQHPIANFAMKLDMNEDSIQELVDIAKKNPVLRVYTMTGDTPYNVEELLKTAGLMEVYRLDGLVLGPHSSVTPAPIQLATGQLRQAAVKFIIDSFFWSSPRGMRQSLSAVLTSVAPDNEFYVWQDEHGVLAAATLVPTEECIGIYNLCVRNEDRGRGYGSHFTSALIGVIKSKGTQGVLQCAPALTAWYSKLGFHKVAEAAALASKTQP